MKKLAPVGMALVMFVVVVPSREINGVEEVIER